MVVLNKIVNAFTLKKEVIKETPVTINVAAGIILDDDGQVFITQRRFDAHLGGFWEFPGGKCNPGESLVETLKRELDEEVGIRLIRADEFHSVTHDYSNQLIQITFFILREYGGVPSAKEKQGARWVPLEELYQFHFPAANLEVIEKLLACRQL